VSMSEKRSRRNVAEPSQEILSIYVAVNLGRVVNMMFSEFRPTGTH